jgi:hypothetical protein
MFHPVWLGMEGVPWDFNMNFGESPGKQLYASSHPSEEGKIYSLVVNETQLDQPRSYTVQLALRKVSCCLPHLRVTFMASNQSSTLYITGKNHLPSSQDPSLGQIFQMPIPLALYPDPWCESLTAS